MRVLRQPNRTRGMAGIVLATSCIATGCGRIGYEYVDLNEATLTGGGALAGGGTAGRPVTTGVGGSNMAATTGGGGFDAVTGAGGMTGSAGAGGTSGGGAGGGSAGADGGTGTGPILYWKFDEASG